MSAPRTQGPLTEGHPTHAGPTDAELRARFTPVLRQVADGVVERERDHVLPHAQVRALADAGLTALRVPREHGGGGATLRQLFALLVDLAQADPNVPQALRGHLAFVEDRLAAPPGDVRDRWLARFVAGDVVGNAVTEIGTVGVGRVATRLEPTADGWALTGRKYYTTGSIFADWVDVSAVTPDGTEVAALVATDQPGVTVTDDWDGFGQRLTGSGTAVFEGAHVDVAHVHPFDTRFPYQTAFYQLLLVAVMAGVSAAAERDVVAELRGRARVYSHGAATESRRDPQLLEAVGRVSAAAAAARAITLDAAAVLDDAAAAVRTGDPEAVAVTRREAELVVSRAQITVGDLALRTTTTLFDPLGASATSRAKALDRHWRNVRTVASHNPVAFKARIVGDAVVNGAEPPYEWSVGVPTARPTP